MKARSTVVLFILVALVGGAVFWIDRQKVSTRQAEENSETLAQYDRAKITGMDITNGDSVIQIRRDSGEWRIISPVKDRADAASVAQILQSANNLSKTAVVEKLGEGSKLRDAFKEYGVQKAKVRLKLLGESAPGEILFGKDTAFEGKIYARLDKEKTVSVVRSDVRNLLLKSVSEFRDRHLTQLDSSKISAVIFKTPTGEIDLAQTGDNWNLGAPIKARASNAKVQDLISSINNITIEEFVAYDDASLEKYGLAEPRGTISFQSRDSDLRDTIEVGAANEKDPAKIYVRVSGRPSVFVVPKNIGEALGVKPNDLRDKSLCRVSEDLIDRLTLEKAGQPPLVFARREQKWRFVETGKPASEVEIKRLIALLNNTNSTAFVDDTGSNLVPYGLDQPAVTVRLSSYSSQNTAEASAGETPLATVQFGKTEGEKLYVRVAEEPFIVSVAPGILNNIATAPAQYRALQINDFEPGDIQEMSFQNGDDNPVTATRAGAKWSSTKGDVFTNLDQIAQTLAKLHAARWLAAPLLEPPFAHAQTITFRAKNTTRKLIVGSLSPDGAVYARFEDDPDLFLLSAETASTLTPLKK